MYVLSWNHIEKQVEKLMIKRVFNRSRYCFRNIDILSITTFEKKSISYCTGVFTNTIISEMTGKQ